MVRAHFEPREALMSISSRKSRVALWIIQGVLAALFLFAGGFKLFTPAATLAKLSPLPVLFMKFIAVCEVTGAVGLILPAALNIRPVLTPLAASGLVIIMIGATVVTVATQGVAPAVMPVIVGILASVVARGRWPVAVRHTPSGAIVPASRRGPVAAKAA